ncbi:pentatricopeptide repeat-containing protein At3g46790, chloroplastic isoform X2 [Phalaenopsis equestris]|uniref:pentatricopeptide repeat-containing protein At3g46790, chloroplastic isoform X2 n=1 Tax=Phalaenopsis equestris TaxID=78828 RepID=UPI0009E2D143|nr:pentatricopeptide repeat-containing protein At3g46790, chloroplastic isoform X2 [Phalaenopsis equestris]
MGTSYTHSRLQAPRFFPKPPNPQLPSSSPPHNLSLRSIFCSHSSFQASTKPSPIPTTNNYNHLIQSLCKQGNLRQALKLLRHEPHPSQRTYEFLILACTRQNSNFYAPFIDRRLAVDGLYRDSFLSTKLIDMYSHFNSLDEARNVFSKTSDKTIFVWNSLLKSLVMAEEGDEALSLLREMGRNAIHGHVIRHGFESRVHVATTLVDSYAKIGKVKYAQKVFDKMPHKNVVSWSAMIACFAKNGRHFDALAIFREMMMTRNPEVAPNSVTMVSVLQACAALAALSQGKLVHGYVLRRGLDTTVSMSNALIALYIKCGSLDFGRRVFDTMIIPKNVVSWNSMIAGYGVHGLGKEAILAFGEMIRVGISPSPVTFVSVLGACSHGALIEEGMRLFNSMEKEHSLKPQSEHYACMVDLLGRAGRLDEAAKIIEKMEMEPGPTVWGSLLGACRIHGNTELAEKACSHLFELEPWNAGNYILLADIYAEAKLWEEVNRVKKLLDQRGLQTLQGCSWIEVKKKLYSFVSVDELNPQIEQARGFLTHLVKEAKEMGYVPSTKVVLCNLEQEEKEKIVLGHSEKLALAFGLINGGQGEVLRITKNLRLCEDCHSLTKFVSKITNREIVVRDVNRFHRFRNGLCSCMDYW